MVVKIVSKTQKAIRHSVRFHADSFVMCQMFIKIELCLSWQSSCPTIPSGALVWSKRNRASFRDSNKAAATTAIPVEKTMFTLAFRRRQRLHWECSHRQNNIESNVTIHNYLQAVSDTRQHFLIDRILWQKSFWTFNRLLKHLSHHHIESTTFDRCLPELSPYSTFYINVKTLKSRTK